MSEAGLAERKCVPCRGGIPPLPFEEAKKLLPMAGGWNLSEDAKRVVRTITFKNFREAMGFVNRVAELAEEEGHHPDLGIHWNKVSLALYTHEINGLHENDFIMAAKINRLA
jgi:4a-hydroxytetrahydrobiopterin dehydratase